MAKRLAIITIEYDDEEFYDAHYALWACDLDNGVIVRKVEEVTGNSGLFPDP